MMFHTQSIVAELAYNFLSNCKSPEGAVEGSKKDERSKNEKHVSSFSFMSFDKLLSRAIERTEKRNG